MKKRYWMVLVPLCLACCLAVSPALGQNGDNELADLIEQEVGNRERNLQAVRHQFESGLTGQDELHRAEQELIQAQQKLTRVRQAQSRNPLTLPIPHLQVQEADLTEVCDVLRDVLEGKVNFILKDGAGELVIPDLDLRETDLLTLLNILRKIVPDLEVLVTAGSRILPLEDVISLTEGEPGAMGMPDPMMGGVFDGFMEMGMGSPPPGRIAWSEQPTIIFETLEHLEPAQRETLTLYLGGLLMTMDFEDILTSIETAWDLSPARSQPTLRFHEDTELLIAAGEEKQLRMIKDVIDQLREMQTDLRNRTKRSLHEEYAELRDKKRAEMEEERQKIVKKAEIAIEEAENRVRGLDEENARLAAAREAAEHEATEARSRFEEERNRLLSEMENEIRQIRERSFYERRELLEKIDALERELKRKLDEKDTAADDSF